MTRPPSTGAPVFDLPSELEASAPPSRRDGVLLLVARPSESVHAQFSGLADFLEPGDLVVVNDSATLAAAVTGQSMPSAGSFHAMPWSAFAS